MSKKSREQAKRVFIGELYKSTYEFSEDDVNYIQLRSGDKANRILITGTIMEVDEGNSEKPMYKITVTDPTEQLTVTAFQEYSPDAYETMHRIDTEMSSVPPAYTVIVGKPQTYTSNGETRVSIQAEQVNIVDKKERDMAIADIIKHTKLRLDNEHDSKRSEEHYQSRTDWITKQYLDQINETVN
jgi:RPA family protein